MRMVRAKRSLCNDRAGGLMLIEAALVFPIILLIVFAIIEYGWLFMKFQHVTNAARAGARVGVRADSTDAEVAAEVGTILSAEGIGGYTLTSDPGSVSTPSTGESLTVTVSVPYADIALLNLPMIPVPGNLRSSVTMAKEGE